MSRILPPNQDTIDSIKVLLAEAERGEILDYCAVACGQSGEFSEHVSGGVFKYRLSYLAYLRVLQIRLERGIQLDSCE